MRAGILDERAGGAGPDLIAAIVADPTLNDRQKQALLEIYRSFQAGRPRRRRPADRPEAG